MRKCINYKNFHSLIEIAVNIDKCIANEKQYSTPESRIERLQWEKKLKKWLKRNYDNPGINEEEYLKTRVLELYKLPESELEKLAEAGKKKLAEEEASALRDIAREHKVG